jgi:hypothetical protein
MINLPATTAQLSDVSWQKLAEETQREIDRITNIRNLLNPQELADRAVECDRKALRAKWAELRNTFIDLGERYRALARKQQKPSFATPRIGMNAADRLALPLSPGLQAPDSLAAGDSVGAPDSPFRLIRAKQLRHRPQQPGLLCFLLYCDTLALERK